MVIPRSGPRATGIIRLTPGGATTGWGRMCDVGRDGRFLMIKPGSGAALTSAAATSTTSLVIVQHFDDELKRLVPSQP